MNERAEQRAELLQRAAACVTNDRQNNYGDAEDNFSDIADMIAIYMGKRDPSTICAQDVAVFNILQKVCRIKTSPQHLDNWIDIAGYAACGGGQLVDLEYLTVNTISPMETEAPSAAPKGRARRTN